MTVEEILTEVTSRLERLEVKYAVGGSLASGAWGQMRHTNDADIAVMIQASDRSALLSEFGDPYILSADELDAALVATDEFRTVQLLNMDEAFKIDLFLLKDSPYERTEMDRARKVEALPGVWIRFSSPENIVLAKLRWYVLGNRVSDRQWNDIVQVLEMQQGLLDDPYLDQWAAHFAVLDLLNLARSQVTTLP